jgi:hypothetical protein
MPSRAVIPSRALRDARLSATDLRVLLAMGSHAEWSGRNIWASSTTMMTEARVTRTSFFRAVRRLTAYGYVTATPRYGPDRRQLTTLYAILHDTPTDEDLPPIPHPVLVPDLAVEPEEGEGAKPVARGSAKLVAREGAKAMAPKQPKEQSPKKKTREKPPKKPSASLPTPGESETIARIWRIYPKRVEPPHDFVRTRRMVVNLLRSGVSAERLEEAAEAYAEECRVGRTEPRFVKGMHNFFDGLWESYERPTTVNGMTRAQWIRARKDVAEFDRLAGADDVPDDAPVMVPDDDAPPDDDLLPIDQLDL